jgi:pimeloyl-ACP methyl ester carboxylesterase
MTPNPAINPLGRTVLYVHGGTFPSALSIAHRFDGRSWRDALCDAGFHVWGLDFHGFGESDPYPEMMEPVEAHPPLGRVAACSRQLETAVRFICEHLTVPRLSLIAHLLPPSLVILVAAQFLRSMPLLLGATAVAGVASALGYRGSLEVVNRIAPNEHRSEVVSSYLIAVYLGNSVPVIGIGVLSEWVSSLDADIFFAGLITFLTLGALLTGSKIIERRLPRHLLRAGE